MRTATTLAALAVAAAGLVAVPGSVHAATVEPVALTDATNWLKSKTDADGLLPSFGGAPSISATADFAKSLDEIGSGELAAVVDDVVTAVESASGGPSQELAQGLWASEALGSADSSLLTAVEDHIAQGGETLGGKTAASAARGRLYDTAFSSYTGTDAQAWAVLALAQAGSDRAADALGYLVAQQCADGGFRTKFSEVDASAQSCAADTGSSDPDLTSSSPDATATAVIFMSELPDSLRPTLVIERAVDWLAAHQDAASGSFSEYYGVSGNSTGLAARALRVADRTAEAQKAALWLRLHQATALGDCPTPLDKDRGAVSYDDDTFKVNLAKGLGDPFAVGSAVSTTSQSLAGLAVLPAGNPVPAIGQTPAVATPGSPTKLSISGANRGDPLCVTIAGAHQRVAAGATSATVTAPRGVASAPVSVQTASGATATFSLKIATAARLGVKAPKKVKRGKRLTVTVTGLWAGEQVTVRLGKKTLGKATADAAGTAILRKKVAKKTRTGRKVLTVTGRFADRVGKRIVKVAR